MSEIYVFSKIDVGGVGVLSVKANGYLYIPVKPLMETLEMSWSAKSRVVAHAIHNLRAQSLNVRLGSGGWDKYVCIRAFRLECLLWLLQPRKPISRARLDQFREAWPRALTARFVADCPSEIEDCGSVIAMFCERNGREEKKQIQALETALRNKDKEIADLRNGTWNMVNARYPDRVKLDNVEAFVKMWELKQQGMDNAAIAREVGKSRTAVSLFLSGKYHDNESTRAAQKIIAGRMREAKRTKTAATTGGEHDQAAAFPTVGNARGGVIHRGGNTHAAPGDL